MIKFCCTQLVIPFSCTFIRSLMLIYFNGGKLYWSRVQGESGLSTFLRDGNQSEENCGPMTTTDNKNILASSAPVQSKSDTDILTLAKEGRTVADFRPIGYLFKSTLQTPSA